MRRDLLQRQVPPHCVPIHANVTSYDWSRLAASAQFDVIMMDPPWALATANPTRGQSAACIYSLAGPPLPVPLPMHWRRHGMRLPIKPASAWCGSCANMQTGA